MPHVHTSVHDPAALAAACHELGLDGPEERAVRLGGEEVFGHAVRLPGLLFPAVVDTLTGLVAYHPGDNAFRPYATLMRFILRVGAVQARRRWPDEHTAAHGGRRRVPARVAC